MGNTCICRPFDDVFVLRVSFHTISIIVVIIIIIIICIVLQDKAKCTKNTKKKQLKDSPRKQPAFKQWWCYVRKVMVWFCFLGSFSFGFYSYRRELTVAFFVCDQKLNLLGKQKIEIDNKQMEKPSNSRAEYWVHCEIDSERWLMKHYSKRREEIVWLWEDWLTIPIRSPYVCMRVCVCALG